MTLEALDRKLHAASAVLVDPRVVRRVVQGHRDLVGLGLGVPHTHCYAVGRAALWAIVDPSELGRSREGVPDPVVLVPRPTPNELARSRQPELLAKLWRTIFHAHVHLELDRLVALGTLTLPTIRQRIAAVGRVEFDEIRAMLRSDELLLPPGGERELYTEFAALYLELRQFAPDLVATTFPGLGDPDAIDAIVAQDVDVAALLDRSCPEGADPAGTVVREAPRSSRAFTATRPGSARNAPPGPLSRVRARRWLKIADHAKASGNDVRAALLRAASAAVIGPAEGEPTLSSREGAPESQTQAVRDLQGQIRTDMRDLSARLAAALSLRDGVDPEAARVQWSSLLCILVEEAARSRRLRYSVEARLLYDLQLAAVAHEKPQSAVDLATWARSLGKLPVIRPLPATREVRIARRIHEAAGRVRHTRLDSPDRKLLAKMMRWASERADRNVRLALRPEIQRVLGEVKLEPGNVPERLARDKLVEELLDRIVAQGFVRFPHLRDALSGNQLKLDDLSGPRELWSGDSLLAADRKLARSLDGVYRGGEVYLRWLQRLSSLSFGTKIGRALLLCVLMPVGIAFVALEGLGYVVVNPLAKHLGYAAVNMRAWPAFVGTALGVLALIHLPWLRAAAWKVLSLLGFVLALLFVRMPRWVLHRTTVREVLRTGVVRSTFRRVVVPAATAAAVTWLTPLGTLGMPWPFVAAGAMFVLLCGAMTPRVGAVTEEVLFDWLAPRWHSFSQQVLPGLFGLVVDVFRRLMDQLERALYRVDELLRFRGKPGVLSIGVRAVVGLVWFFVAYIIRLYVTLLIEPEVNPLKYVPVGMVSQKLSIPWTGKMFAVSQTVFSPLGAVVGNALASVTTFFLPSIAGFFAWEFGANWKLYRASRRKVLGPVSVGSHGETIAQLMVPGIHSGTLPKMYERLRRAAQREDHLARARALEGQARRPVAEGARGRFRMDLEHVEIAVRHFVERELAAVLSQSPHWTFGALAVVGVHLVPNRIRIELGCHGLGSEPLQIVFEEKHGHVVASMPSPGSFAALPPAPHPVGIALENALAGLYQLAGVGLVHEQVMWALGGDAHYDLEEKNLVVWPDGDYRTELLYRLESRLGRTMAKAKVRGVKPQAPPPSIDRRELSFAKQTITWAEWVEAWTPRSDGTVPRLVRGASLLPRMDHAPAAASAPAGAPDTDKISTLPVGAAEPAPDETAALRPTGPTPVEATPLGAAAPLAAFAPPAIERAAPSEAAPVTQLSPAAPPIAPAPVQPVIMPTLVRGPQTPNATLISGVSGGRGSSSPGSPDAAPQGSSSSSEPGADGADPALGRSAQQRTPVE
jgi:hypothetical protein